MSMMRDHDIGFLVICLNIILLKQRIQRYLRGSVLVPSKYGTNKKMTMLSPQPHNTHTQMSTFVCPKYTKAHFCVSKPHTLEVGPVPASVPFPRLKTGLVPMPSRPRSLECSLGFVLLDLRPRLSYRDSHEM